MTAKEERGIIESNQLEQKKQPTGLKTHDEILKLIKEIETIETQLQSPETIEESLPVFEAVDEETEQPEIEAEIVKEPITFEIPSEIETTTEPIEKWEKKKRFPSIKIRKTTKPKNLKTKYSRIWKKIKPDNIQDSSNRLEQHTKHIGEITPIKPTFTLRIDNQGNLVGLNIKKPKPKKEKRRPTLKKATSKESETEETIEESGLKGKIKNLFSRIKPKKSESEGGSKISNILGKIKGIFSRSSKE